MADEIRAGRDGSLVFPTDYPVPEPGDRPFTMGSDEIHGRDLVVGDVFGYACPTHGLRYYRVGEEGLLVCFGAESMVQLDPSAPSCPLCLSPLGSALPAGDVCGEMLVPGLALEELRWVGRGLDGRSE